MPPKEHSGLAQIFRKLFFYDSVKTGIWAKSRVWKVDMDKREIMIHQILMGVLNFRLKFNQARKQKFAKGREAFTQSQNFLS